MSGMLPNIVLISSWARMGPPTCPSFSSGSLKSFKMRQTWASSQTWKEQWILQREEAKIKSGNQQKLSLCRPCPENHAAHQWNFWGSWIITSNYNSLVNVLMQKLKLDNQSQKKSTNEEVKWGASRSYNVLSTQSSYTNRGYTGQAWHDEPLSHGPVGA